MGRAGVFPTLPGLVFAALGCACTGFGRTGAPLADPPDDGEAAADDDEAGHDGDGSTDDGSGRPPLHPDRPGGWTRASFVFSYHRGSHSNPLLQVLDAAGAFRGYVRVEIQRSARTEGRGQVPEDAWLQTDYRVFRWIEEGFQESGS